MQINKGARWGEGEVERYYHRNACLNAGQVTRTPRTSSVITTLTPVGKVVRHSLCRRLRAAPGKSLVPEHRWVTVKGNSDVCVYIPIRHIMNVTRGGGDIKSSPEGNAPNTTFALMKSRLVTRKPCREPVVICQVSECRPSMHQYSFQVQTGTGHWSACQSQATSEWKVHQVELICSWVCSYKRCLCLRLPGSRQ